MSTKKVKGTLEGQDGNAFMLIGYFGKLAKRQGWTSDEISAVRTEAMSGDYSHLLSTLVDNMTNESED